MTNFGTLLKQMWSQKRRFIYLVFLINICVVLFLSGYFLLFRNWGWLTNAPANNLGQFWRNNFAGITIYIDFAFCAITCWQNEKINLSQTWHLVASDERKTYLANNFSSLVACGYFFLLQQIVNTLLLIPSFGAGSFAQAFREFSLYPTKMIPGVESVNNQMLIFRWIFIVLIILFIYFFVSFANFISRVITDFLPFKSTLWARLLIIAILVIVAVYCGIIFMSRLNGFIDKRPALQVTDPIWLNDLCLFAVSFILGILNLILVKRFVEAKGINY